MPKNFANALHKYQHPKTKRPQHAPQEQEQPNYVATAQWSKEESALTILTD